LDNAGGCEQGTGDDLAHIQGVEIQAFIQLGSERICLRPRGEFSKLLFDNRARAIFGGAAYHSAISPKLRCEGEPRFHGARPHRDLVPHWVHSIIY